MAKKSNKPVLQNKKVSKKRLIKSPEEMEERAIEYFNYCNEENKLPNVAGLMLFMGFTDRRMLSQYDNEYPDYREIISWIRLYLENANVEMLANKDYSTAGIIFNLKCNHDYNDKQQEENEKVNNMASALSVAMDIIKNQSMNNESSNH